jgi:hypothetical protein
LATPKENRSWKSGKKGARKKKANPQVFGLVLTLCALAAVLIWAIWPRPMVQVQLFVISADEEVEYDGKRLARYHTAKVDNEAVFNVFAKLAEQVQSVVSAKQIPVGKLKGMPAEDLDGRKRVGIVFLNAFSRAVLNDNDEGRLQLQFGSDRQTIGFEELVLKFEEAKFREVILLLEVAHERPEISSEFLAIEGPALLEAAVQRFVESHPDLKLTVISSTAELNSSYPFLVAAESLPDLEEFDQDREVISGTAFGQTVAEVFEAGEFWTIDDLAKEITSGVENYVSTNFRGDQSPQRYATYTSEEPVDIIREKHTVVVEAIVESDEEETAEEESPPEKKEPADDVKQSPDGKFIAFRKKISGLLDGYELNSLSINDLLQLKQYASDLKYTLDHGDLGAFGTILDQGERLILQVQSAAKSSSDIQQKEELQLWIPPIDVRNGGTSAFFSAVLAEVNDGEDQRSPQVVEKLKTRESRDQLLLSFLSVCKHAQEEIEVDTPEAKMQRVAQIQDWRKFFQRLAKKAGWHGSEWPHQFLLASDLLRGINDDWTDSQFAAFLNIQLHRSEGLLLASGWKADGSNRLYQDTFKLIEPQLKELLKETTAAERSFLLGQTATGILETHLLAAEKSLAEIDQILGEAGDRYDFLTQRRLKIFAAIGPIALQHNSIILSPEQLQSLSKLSASDLLIFSAVNFPQASFSREVSSDDALALLQMTTKLTTQSPRQLINETELAINRFRELSDTEQVLTAVEEFQSPMVHQGIWLSFWSIRSLQALSNKAIGAELMDAWLELVQSIADEKTPETISAKRAVLASLLQENWQSLSKNPIVTFQPVNFEGVRSLVSTDLERHAHFAGSRYSGRYRRIFEESPSSTKVTSLQPVAGELKISSGTTNLGLQIPDGTLLYYYPDGVRLQNPNFRDVNGWQVGPWSQAQSNLKATSKFRGTANPVIAVVDQEGIVQDFQNLHVGVAFEATGWKVRFLSKGVRLPEIDLSDEEKVITLPPQTGEEPLPITVMLLQPESSFAKSVMVNIATLDESGEPESRLWPQFQELPLDGETKSVEIPLTPAAPEGEPSPVQIPENGFDFTKGIAFIVRPKDAADQEVEVVLKVRPKFFNPLDQHLELGDLEFDTERHKLSVQVRRRPNIRPEHFPPKKIGAEINFSRDLDPFSMTPPPKRPEITENFEILESTFTPEIHEAIRISETTIGKDRLEFGLTVDGLENIAKWRLGQSEVMERIGYARSGSANQFGNRTEIRIGMNLANKKEDGVQAHNLDGRFVLGEKWRNAVLNLPLELYGYQAEQASHALLILNLLTEGNAEPLTLAEIPVIDAYDRTLSVSSEKPGVWLFKINSQPHGKFAVNLFESFRIPEGIHQLEATLKDENIPQPIAAYQTKFIIEDSAPGIEWKASDKPENPEKVVTSQDYRGWITVHDPQTGVVSVAVGLGKESMVSIDLKGNVGQTKPLKIPFLIQKSFYPEIPAKNVPIEKRITVQVEAKNSIGMLQTFSEDLVLIQPAANMSPTGDKTGTLLVKMSSKSKFDFVLTGAGGKVKRELPDTEGTARFDDLPEGNYRLNWKKHYPLKNDGKSIKIEFKKTGDVFNLAI